MLIDGRNRLEACQRAGVEPDFEQINGIDPIAFILSSNDKRRHMNKGQRAMIAARIRELSKNERSIPAAAKEAKVAQGYVAEASLVLRSSPTRSSPAKSL
jgi:hypothetical protein